MPKFFNYLITLEKNKSIKLSYISMKAINIYLLDM